MTGLHGSEGLVPHAELSPFNPPSFLADRTTSAIKVFQHSDVFDAVVRRPTTVYGLAGSFCAVFHTVALKPREKGMLELCEDPGNRFACDTRV